MNEKLIIDLMQAVAAGTIVATQQPDGKVFTNEEIADTVMLGLHLCGHNELSEEEKHLVASACTVIAGARDSQEQLAKIKASCANESSNDEESPEPIKIIYKKNEYPS